MTDETPDTSLDAFQAVREEGEDVSLRLRVAAAIKHEPRTTAELSSAFPDHSANAIRPRVNELLRMECVERRGKRENPSGHEAYVHHITERGVRYLDGEITPEPGPTLAELKERVVDIAREVVRNNVDDDVLHAAVDHHDDLRRRMDPEWGGGLGGDQ